MRWKKEDGRGKQLPAPFGEDERRQKRDKTTVMRRVQPGAISKAVQLIAGRVGQEYNQRKGRKGAFWEDRYHATAIQAGDHLIRCFETGSDLMPLT